MLQKVRNQVDLRSIAPANRYGLRAVSAKPTERIREYTIRKIIKTELLSPRVFIDFYYCVSRHPAAPTKIDKPVDKGGFELEKQYFHRVRKLGFRKLQFFSIFELFVI